MGAIISVHRRARVRLNKYQTRRGCGYVTSYRPPMSEAMSAVALLLNPSLSISEYKWLLQWGVVGEIFLKLQ